MSKSSSLNVNSLDELLLAKLQRLRDLHTRKADLDRLAPHHGPVWECPDPVCDGRPHEGFDYKHARASQRLPAGDWLIWYLRWGRGTGKTRTGAEELVDWALEHPVDEDGIPTEWGVFADTIADARDINFRGPSGILNVLKRRRIGYVYNKVEQTITLNNGALIRGIGADDEDTGRGYNLAGAWLDEVVKWANGNSKKITAIWLEGILPSLRSRVPGWRPRAIVTTTPKPIQLLKDWQSDITGRVLLTRGATMDNADNLSEAALAALVAQYEGTRIGRQELYGELLEDVPGALWTLSLIDEHRRRDLEPEDLIEHCSRIVVSLDPAATSNEDSDENGLIVAGRSACPGEPRCKRPKCSGHYWILEDASAVLSPNAWAQRAVNLYRKWKADRVIAEQNHGYEMIEALIRHVDPQVSYSTVHASKGKHTRAEPIAALYELGVVHHVGPSKHLARLEDQLTSWTPDMPDSPDRLDALVWALTELSETSGARSYLTALLAEQRAS